MSDKYYSFETIKDTIMSWIGEQTVSKYPTFAECKAARMGAEGVIYALEDVPTADVTEVKHGEWEVCSDEYEICASEFVCSCCKESFASSELTDEQFFEMMNFCPNCGAKMGRVFHEHKETPFMPPKTNYDVITSKSLERLAEFLIWICHEPIFSDFTKEDWIEELSKESD